MEANQPNSREEILKKHYEKKYGVTIDVSKTYKEILDAMTEYRSIGEREAREQVINELAGWMEAEQKIAINKKAILKFKTGSSDYYSGWDSGISGCITHAKSLLNQQPISCKCGNVQIAATNENGFEMCDICKEVVGKPLNQQGEETKK